MGIWSFALRSQGRQPDNDTDLYVADTLGEMGLFLRLADVVVMGGSFSAANGRWSVTAAPANVGRRRRRVVPMKLWLMTR